MQETPYIYARHCIIEKWKGYLIRTGYNNDCTTLGVPTINTSCGAPQKRSIVSWPGISQPHKHCYHYHLAIHMQQAHQCALWALSIYRKPGQIKALSLHSVLWAPKLELSSRSTRANLECTISCTKLLPLLECQKLNFVRPFAKLKIYPLSEIHKIIYRQNKNLTVLVSKKKWNKLSERSNYSLPY